MASIRKQLNLISSRGEAVYNKIYVDEFGVTYRGNKQGRLEKVQGPLNSVTASEVNSLISTSSSTPVPPVQVFDIISPFLLMGG